MASMHELRLKKMFQASKGKKSKFAPSSLATGTGGMTCTATSCDGTLNGTVACTSGGTVKLTNVTTTISFPANPNDPMNMGFDTTMKGQITLDKCASTSPNYLDYPNYLATIGTGTLTVDAKSGFKLNSFSYSGDSTSFNMNMNVTMTENATVSSESLKVGTETISLKDLKTVFSATIDSKGTNIQMSSSGSDATFKADYEDTLDGSFTTSGTVNGESVNTTLTYEKSKVYKYSVSCNFNMQTGASTCAVTMK